MSPYRDYVLKFTWKCGECGKMNTQRKRRAKKLSRKQEFHIRWEKRMVDFPAR